MVRASDRETSATLAARLLASLAGADSAREKERFCARANAQGITPSEDAKDLGALVAFAYPELGKTCRASDIALLARGTKVARDVRTYRKLFFSSLSDLNDDATVRKRLREFAAREKLRVAIRELLYADIDVDVTARELSDLAEVCIDVALSSAMLWGEARFGSPTNDRGEKIPIAIIGMGKLGGRELNAGSDVDLFVVYETDDGSAVKQGESRDISIHEFMTRVTQRMVQILEDVTDEGIVWRVDMRLRPEGNSGPLVNSLAALESYYESWGRTWERAALLRGRAVAGDLAFGANALLALAPFVWRREVNPLLARELGSLVVRARAEGAREDDLKLGVGGIREAEFFVQSLQLIWGGRDASLRTVNTIDAARRLRTRGFVTEREARDLVEAYVFLRRLEHRVQFATMRQTHEFPEPALAELIAKTTGFEDAKALEAETKRVKKNVSALLASLDEEKTAPPNLSRERFFAALDAHDEAAVLASLPDEIRNAAAPDLPRHLVALARRPDFPLGSKTRDAFPESVDAFMSAIEDAADPEQAARLFASFFSRLRTPSVYARALATDERATRRVTALFGGSAFLAESLLAQPDLVDRLLFVRSAPKRGDAKIAIDEEIAAQKKDGPSDASEDDDELELLVSSLRRAKSRVMLEVGLADLAGEISLRDAAQLLTELADETLERATSAALRERNLDRGLCVVAMGKLGGRELGYGSDLDLFFVYDGPEDSAENYVRCAQRVMRLVGMPHGDGPGYELDARLRPSGNQGLLVVSLEAFARYHGAANEGERARAHAWERQALVKARPCAGDRDVGARVLKIAHAAAFEEAAPSPEKIVEMRLRMERELARERHVAGHARYDAKLGFGGLADIEFAVQYLQMKNGKDPRVRSTDTETALLALETCGYLDLALSGPLREGYTFLRRLEQRVRVLHGTSAALLEEGAFGLSLLARRMGMRDSPRGTAAESLLVRYLAVTRDVRAAFEGVLGITTSSIS